MTGDVILFDVTVSIVGGSYHLEVDNIGANALHVDGVKVIVAQ